jgi:hypothetical protein
MLRVLRFAALSLSALCLAPRFAHVLEMGPKLQLGASDYGLVQGIYVKFGPVGSVLEPLAIASVIATAIATRGRRGFAAAVVAAVAIVATLVSWIVLVAPMNTAMAAWADGIPLGWERVRMRWEVGHVIGFGLNLMAFLALVVSVLADGSARSSTAQLAPRR